MSHNRSRTIAVLALLMALIFTPGRAGAEQVFLSEEAQRCLECHAKQGIMVKFQDGDSLRGIVDANQLRNSVHKSLTCSNCHVDFSTGNHPPRLFKSKLQYQIKSSLVCRRCHTDEQIRKHPVHEGLLREEQRGSAPVCANCHGSHAIQRVSARNVFASEERYCMKCHSGRLAMTFGNRESMSLKVDAQSLRDSVHAKLSCSDCHFGFSSEEHPQRRFRTARDFVLASSDSCRRCHIDKYTKTLESIHYTMLSQGNLNAPVCIDCHGAHDISRSNRERLVSAMRCQRCHARQYETYAKSVHGNALFNEHNKDVPVCIDCHTAHDIQSPLTLDYRERIPEMCSNCHAKKEVVGKYGLSVDVVKTYLSDFHGVTLGLYKLQKGDAFKPARPIAVCTDCHGTHNITSTIGPNATTLKTNLVKRCQKCHKDANKNFPDAWLSHYEPSFKRAPLVFAAAFVYKLFIPLIIIGLILQILLHIWRFAVNR